MVCSCVDSMEDEGLTQLQFKTHNAIILSMNNEDDYQEYKTTKTAFVNRCVLSEARSTCTCTMYFLEDYNNYTSNTLPPSNISSLVWTVFVLWRLRWCLSVVVQHFQLNLFLTTYCIYFIWRPHSTVKSILIWHHVSTWSKTTTRPIARFTSGVGHFDWSVDISSSSLQLQFCGRTARTCCSLGKQWSYLPSETTTISHPGFQ